MKTMTPFGRFVRPRAERYRRPRLEGGQRTISARACVGLHDGQVLQAHERERSATTLCRCLRVLARAYPIRSRALITARYVDLPTAQSCLRKSHPTGGRSLSDSMATSAWRSRRPCCCDSFSAAKCAGFRLRAAGLTPAGAPHRCAIEGHVVAGPACGVVCCGLQDSTCGRIRSVPPHQFFSSMFSR